MEVSLLNAIKCLQVFLFSFMSDQPFSFEDLHYPSTLILLMDTTKRGLVV